MKNLRKKIDGELLRVLAGNMVHSEGESEESLEKKLFTEAWEGVRKTKRE